MQVLLRFIWVTPDCCAPGIVMLHFVFENVRFPGTMVRRKITTTISGTNSRIIINFSSFVQNAPMIEQQIKNIILNHLKDYQPISVGIFGSFARGENNENSDIDILVKFKVAPTLITLIRLENELSEILGIKVDLVTTGAVKNRRVKHSIQKDLISIL